MSKTEKNIAVLLNPLKEIKSKYTFPNFSVVNSWNLGTILPPVFTNRTFFVQKANKNTRKSTKP